MVPLHSMCTIEGNTGTTAATGITPHIDIIRWRHICHANSQHYSAQPVLPNRHCKGTTAVLGQKVRRHNSRFSWVENIFLSDDNEGVSIFRYRRFTCFRACFQPKASSKAHISSSTKSSTRIRLNRRRFSTAALKSVQVTCRQNK